MQRQQNADQFGRGKKRAESLCVTLEIPPTRAYRIASAVPNAVGITTLQGSTVQSVAGFLLGLIYLLVALEPLNL
jgi:hypothetical protein